MVDFKDFLGSNASSEAEEEPDNGRVEKKSLHELAKTRYLNYAMSVISSRALPDIRDGLKPVQRRILYAMSEDLKLHHTKKHRKSAAVVGKVLGSYHAHGDQALYEAMVRLAQDWVMMATYVDGHGNFGSVDGDNAASLRYTEARLRPIVADLMRDIRKNAVDFRPNFDNTTTEPEVLPFTAPMLLVNGSQGIAVGMATKIPTHNLGEVIDACIDLIRNPSRQSETLLRNHLKGPDFPTGGSIVEGTEALEKMYAEGRGTVTIRSKWEVETKGKQTRLVITEIPYGVQKQKLVEKIAEHVVEDKIPLITDVRDESTKDVRVVLELKKGADVDAVLAYLIKYTPFQDTFSINMTCLVPEGDQVVPKCLSLAEMLQYFIDFRLETQVRCLNHDLERLQKRVHILKGFMKVLDDVQKAIQIVLEEKTKQSASDRLQKSFGIDEVQANYVLDTKIYKLAGNEIETLKAELDEKEKEIAEFEATLADEDALRNLVIKDLKAFKKAYGQPRRTVIEEDLRDFEYDEALFIEDQDVYCILTRLGWVRRQKSYTDLGTLRVKDGDDLRFVLKANTRDVIVLFTTKGKAYTARVDDLPDTTGYGEPIQKIFSFEDHEWIVEAKVFGPDDTGDGTTFMAVSDDAQAVRFEGSKFVEPSQVTGRTFMRLNDEAEVVNVCEHEEEGVAVLVSREGRVLAFDPEEVKVIKSVGKGISAMTISSKDSIIAFGITSGQRGGSLKVETSRGTIHEIRHTTHGVLKRGHLGNRVLKRDEFVKWHPEVKEV